MRTHRYEIKLNRQRHLRALYVIVYADRSVEYGRVDTDGNDIPNIEQYRLTKKQARSRAADILALPKQIGAENLPEKRFI